MISPINLHDAFRVFSNREIFIDRHLHVTHRKSFVLFMWSKGLTVSFSVAFKLYGEVYCTRAVSGAVPSYKDLNNIKILRVIFDENESEIVLDMHWCFEDKKVSLLVPKTLHDLYDMNGEALSSPLDVYKLFPRLSRKGNMEYQENRS